MSTTPVCPDCQQPMEQGFIPDASYSGALRSCWHAGTPEDRKFLGLKVPGSMGTQLHLIKYDPEQMRAITSYRCTGCGLLKFYA